MLSKHSLWLTVTKETNFSRKSAPENAKLPLTEAQKQRFKPTWIEIQNAPRFIDNHNSKKKTNKGVTKSVFEIGSYRHNIATREQLLQPTFCRDAAGKRLNAADSIEPIASIFLKDAFTSSMRHIGPQIEIKPYSIHSKHDR